jgi:hypothetical protein
MKHLPLSRFSPLALRIGLRLLLAVAACPKDQAIPPTTQTNDPLLPDANFLSL